LEALHLTDYLDREPNAKTPEDTKKADLAWKNAAKFLSKLQHLPESNDAVWVVKDKNDPNRGSFIYQFGVSRAGYEADGKTLRGYGSMTYAGLKSMIYAKLKKDDPRVKAAVEWGAKHYTLKENPGIGPHGWFYYIQTFAKAHAAYGGDIIVTPDGKKHNWRVDLLNELISLQQKDGTWVNKKSGRWWEAIPQLITAYSMISMEVALGDDLKK
jgi:squalene-hopene/tetraprenyl-beta-curcumene cyclase